MGILQEEAESGMMQLFFSSLRPLTLLSLFIFSLVPETVHSSGCGLKKSPMQDQNRIINGTDAEVNEWPWMVSLQRFGWNKRSEQWFHRHLCGGAVIGKRWIITAARCLVKDDGSPRYDPEKIKVYLGDHHLTDASETDKVEVYRVENFTAHENYSYIKWSSKELNDIAVIKVSKDIDLDRHTPVCLPQRDRKYGNHRNSQEATAIYNWAPMIHYGIENITDVLQEVSLSIYDCYEIVRLCVDQEKSHSTCRSKYYRINGGGPITIVDSKGRHTLVGVANENTYCDDWEDDTFADVSYYRDWIKEKTGI